MTQAFVWAGWSEIKNPHHRNGGRAENAIIELIFETGGTPASPTISGCSLAQTGQPLLF
jgi:hypothetical protein